MRKQLCGMLTGIFFVFALSACTNSAPSSETIPSETQAAPNSFSQVASITRQARDAANTATENDISTAYEYIKSNYTDCFKDNATMEQMMYYGWLLEYTYEGNTEKQDYYTLGQNKRLCTIYSPGQIPPTATAPKPAWNRYNIQIAAMQQGASGTNRTAIGIHRYLKRKQPNGLCHQNRQKSTTTPNPCGKGTSILHVRQRHSPAG